MNPMDKPNEKLEESLGSWEGIIKRLFSYGIFLLLGPGLVIAMVSEIINQGDDFSLWDSEYGPDHP